MQGITGSSAGTLFSAARCGAVVDDDVSVIAPLSVIPRRFRYPPPFRHTPRRRGIQYAAAFEVKTNDGDYWIVRLRGR